VSLSFLNFSGNAIKLYWVDGQTKEETLIETLEKYQGTHQDTHIGHTFAYTHNGVRQTLVIEPDIPVYVIGVEPVENDDISIPVECSTTEGDLHITVKPHWSPRGAARFLELVDMDYFEGCALNRVVKNFLTQFGISKNYAHRTGAREATIADDVPHDGLGFKPGFMAFAGSGPNSRTTEMFIVMPGTSTHQLAHFGDNPWETPFAFVAPEDVKVVADWYSYGDMPPWGEGPSPSKIYEEDGYDYLAKEFPKLSYITNCRIVADGTGEEEEL
jgi:cyclophilin family peptidyl-prolyl cis-trans isomerase